METFADNKISFEDVNCLICGSGETIACETIRWRGTEMHFVICSGCGLKYMRPRPTRQWYAEFYKREFWESKVSDRSFTLTPLEPVGSVNQSTKQMLEKLRQRAAHIHSLISPVVPLSSTSLVLEIGCGWGETLGLLRQRYGCRVLGVEPSELARSYAERTHKVQFVGGYVEDMANLQSFDHQVDLVIMSHVLENILDPLGALHSVRKLLKPTGCLYIETPNFYYHWNAANPYHPYVFSPETLGALLNKTGFEVVKQLCDEPPRVIQRRPTSIYLTVIASLGSAVFEPLEVDSKQLLADWHLGMRLMGLSWVQEEYRMESIAVSTEPNQGMIQRVKSTMQRILGEQAWNMLRDAYQRIKR